MLNSRNLYFLNALAAILVGLSGMLLVHYWLPNLLNGYHQTWQTLEGFMAEEMKFRHTDPVFSRRLLTTFLIDRLFFGFACSYWHSFQVVGFGLWAAVGGVAAVLSRYFGYSVREMWFEILIFFSSFSVLFAYCSPIYSYDEPLQYLFLGLASLFLYKKQDFGLFLMLIGAVFARETSVLLFPSLFWLYLHQNSIEKSNEDEKIAFLQKIKPFYKPFFLFSTPIVVYIAFYYYFYSGFAEDKGRFLAWQVNFQNIQFTAETIASVLLVLALPLRAVFGIFPQKLVENGKQKHQIQAFLAAALLNTMVVLLTATAREARLFMLPILLLLGNWSFFYKLFFRDLYQQNIFNFNKNKLLFLLKLLFNIIIAFIISFVLYKSTDSAGSNVYYQIYLFLVLCLLGFSIFIAERRSID